MTDSRSQFARAAAGYLQKTHRPLNCLMFLLPLLAAYEAGALFYHDRLLAPAHLRLLMEHFGASARLLPALVIVVVLIAWHALTRQKWQVDGDAVLGMAVESVLLMAPMIGLAMLTDRMLLSAASAHPGGAPTGAPPLPAEILSGLGAGIYEEFLFRLAGIGLILLVCVDAFKLPKGPVVLAALAVTSLAFSGYHFLGGEEFSWHLFTFRALAGAYLAALYVTRGFGVAVGVHACYNVLLAVRGPT